VFRCCFQIGSWQTILCACTPDVERPVQEFKESFLFVPSEEDFSTVSRILAVASPAIMEDPEPPHWLAEAKAGEWKIFHSELKRAYLRYCQVQPLNDGRGKSTSDLFPFIWSPQVHETSIRKESPSGTNDRQYIAMIVEHPEALSPTRIWGYSFYQAARWHVEHGGLNIHSSAVARGENGFLFLGVSESGKSTVAQMSHYIGLSPLGDDLNFILNDARKGYRLSAIPGAVHSTVGYSWQKPFLRGIFFLVKDRRNSLIPLSPMQLARYLFNGFNVQSPYVQQFPDVLIVMAFHTVCEIAHRVPGYELHFRKSPDFWKLINEQFPD
jgi:hypothetical protein